MYKKISIILIALLVTGLAAGSMAADKSPDVAISIFVSVFNSDGTTIPGPTTGTDITMDIWGVKATTGEISRHEDFDSPGFDWLWEDFGPPYGIWAVISFIPANFKKTDGNDFGFAIGDSFIIRVWDNNPPFDADTGYFHLLVDADVASHDPFYDTLYLLDSGTGITEAKSELPMVYYLHQNHPNPFNASTIIEYGIPVANDVKLTITNILGEDVRTLVNENQSAGHKKVAWDATDDTGNRVSTGIYFYKVKTEGFEAQKRMILLK
ncbi:T9SS type A sorting domain-containing protein [bacterium]|nr:T9SS type A sorting domain-containing protein [bacterium]